MIYSFRDITSERYLPQVLLCPAERNCQNPPSDLSSFKDIHINSIINVGDGIKMFSNFLPKLVFGEKYNR